jgi:hypothetical protein
MLRLFAKVLGIPQGIPFEKLKPFDQNVPVLVQHQRSVSKGLAWLGVFIGVIVFMNTIEKVYHPIEYFSSLLQSPFNGFVQMLQGVDGHSSETGEQILIACFKGVGFVVGFIPSIVPVLVAGVAAVRSVLEFFPGIKNPKIPS